jgi:proteasome lid subunit RPN8/RPN11
MSLARKIGKLFELDRFVFENVVIERDVIENIVAFARENHPREFIMFLEGKVKDKVLRIDALSFQEYVSNNETAVARINFPIGTKIVGSVHSHPGPSNRPSNADLRLFSKQGMVHLIIRYPYTQFDIAAYDKNGRAIKIAVGE